MIVWAAFSENGIEMISLLLKLAVFFLNWVYFPVRIKTKQ